LIALVLVTPLLVLFVQQGADGAGVLQGLAYRIAAEGDAYAYFLGDDAIDRIARFDALALIRPVLAALRLVPIESALNPGFEIVTEVLGVESPTAGPNSRLPIYLLFFYGPYGIVLAPLLGMLLGAARNYVLACTRRAPVTYALAAASYYHLAKLEVDPQSAVGGLFAMLLAYPVIWLARTAGKSLAPRIAERPFVRITT
jgi:hypothetical protein